MFLRNKEFYKPQLEIMPKHDVSREENFDALSLLLQAEQAISKVSEKNPLLKFFKRVKEQPIDAIENYFRRFFKYQQGEWAVELATSDAERAAILVPDFQHTIWEMLEAKKETVFPIELNKEAGFGEGYSESMELQLSNFARLIEQQGLLASRSFLEQVLFQRVYNQLFDVAQNHVDHLQTSETNTLYPNIAVLVTSPPDFYEAGYHGIDSFHNWNAQESHHSFHFVYLIDKIETRKNAQGKIEVTNVSVKTTQFRTWHNIQGLLDLHQRLGTPIEIDDRFPVTNQIIANKITFTFSESDSHQDILDYFRKELYVGEKKWARNTEQTPQFSEEGAKQFWDEIGVVSLEEYEKSNKKSLFHSVYLQPVFKLLSETSEKDIQNHEVRQRLHEQIELRTQVFLQAVELRVRELNINPEYTKLVERNLLFSALKNPLQLPMILKQLKRLSSDDQQQPLNEPERLQTIVQTHHLLEQKQIFKKKLSKEELSRLSSNMSSVLAIGDYAFGSMQCLTIGTLKIPMQLADIGATADLSSAMAEALEQVDIDTKQKLLRDLEATNYVELDLPGADRIWMVPASYLTAPGCRVDKNGMVCGPCITEDFPLGIPFDHPLEQENPLGPLPMDQIQYANYINQLKENILQDQLKNQLDFDNLSEKDQLKARTLIKDLTRKLFKVNLSNLIAGVDEHQEAAYKLPQEKLQKITNIESLEKLVIEFEKEDSNQAYSELEELAETIQAA